MISACQMIWRKHGAPAVDGEQDADGMCWCCGGTVHRGVSVQPWLTKTLTDQNTARCPESQWVCSACVGIRARFSPVPPRPIQDGKKQAPRWSNFSHCWCDRGGYFNASKGEKPAILAFLRSEKRGPWFAGIADSGQKHVLPYTPVNHHCGVGGLVRFEEQTLEIPDEWTLVDDMVAILTAGATKAEIETGRYTPGTYQRCGVKMVQVFEATHGALRGGAWMSLALWLSQRDEEAVAARMAAEKEAKRGKTQRRATRKAANQGGGVRARGSASVSPDRVQRAEALAPDREPDAQRSKARSKRRRVDDAGSSGATDPKPIQGRLPGFD